MRILDATELCASIATEYGYRRRGALMWKPVGDVVILVQLQKSRWGNGVYVNFGATPIEMVTKPVPPSYGYWGLHLRAPEWSGPYVKAFIRCETDCDDRMRASELERPFQWLFRQLNKFMSDGEWLRKVVLDPECVECVHADAMMRDWARGRLKAPLKYFKGTSYYSPQK